MWSLVIIMGQMSVMLQLPCPAEHAVYFYASLPPIIFSSEVDQQFQIKKLFELINVQVGHHQLTKRLYTVCR